MRRAHTKARRGRRGHKHFRDTPFSPRIRVGTLRAIVQAMLARGR